MAEPDIKVQQDLVAKYCTYVVLVGLGAMTTTITMNTLFAVSGERLTRRLRKQSFAAIVKQEIPFFDEEKNGVGYLTSRLSSDATRVKGVSKYLKYNFPIYRGLYYWLIINKLSLHRAASSR